MYFTKRMSKWPISICYQPYYWSGKGKLMPQWNPSTHPPKSLKCKTDKKKKKTFSRMWTTWNGQMFEEDRWISPMQQWRKEARHRYKSVSVQFQGRRVGLRTVVCKLRVGSGWEGHCRGFCDAGTRCFSTWVLVSWMPSVSKTMKLTQYVHFSATLE